MVKKKPKNLKKRVKGLEDKVKEIDKIDKRLSVIESEEEKIENTEQKLEGLVDKEENEIEKIEGEEKKIENEEERIEKVLLKVGNFTVKRTHLLELARGFAGAFLGVGVGLGLRWVPSVAEPLSWINVMGILAFVFLISGVLIYKQEKETVKKAGMMFIFKKLLIIYFLCLAVEMIAFALFDIIPSDIFSLIKSLVVGSYPAMAGAITFTLI